jgi:hypothetical protein
MSENSFTTEFVIIGKEKDSFIESYIGEDIEGTNLGEFFVVIELINKYMDGEEIGEALTETFRKTFYSNVELDAYTRFEEALKAVNSVALDLERDEGFVLSNINVAIGAVIDHELFLTQANDAEVYLVRKGYISDISAGLSGKGRRKESSELFENVANGELEEGDVILFSSTRLFRYISQTEIGRLFFTNNLRSSIDALEDALRTEVLGRIGVVGFRFVERDFKETFVESSSSSSRFSFDKVKELAKFRNLKKLKSVDFSVARDTLLKVYVKGRDLIKSLYNGHPISIDPKAKKKAIGVFVAVVAILFIGTYGILSSTLNAKEIKKYEDLLNQGFSIVDSAKSEVDKERITELLQSAESKANQVIEVRGLKDEAQKLKEDIRDVRFTLDDVVLVSEPKVFANFSTVTSTPNLVSVRKLQDTVYAFENEKMYEVLAGTIKDPQSILDDGKFLDAYRFDDFESIVIMLGEGRIKEYIGGVVKNMDIEGGLKPAKNVISYGSRIYTLDPEAGKLWKYQRKRDSYGPAEIALPDEFLKNVSLVAIDGSIYTVSNTGEINQYYAGELQEGFDVVDTPLLPLTSPTDIYTDADTPYVFILEADQKRVLQYFKSPRTGDLQYATQYFFETLNDLRGFTVDFEDKTLYVIDKTKIYTVDIKA